MTVDDMRCSAPLPPALISVFISELIYAILRCRRKEKTSHSGISSSDEFLVSYGVIKTGVDLVLVSLVIRIAWYNDLCFTDMLVTRATGNSRFKTEKFPPLSEKFPKIPVVCQA